MFEYPWGTSEDDLTRSFFGLMKYLPGDALLVPFLSLIQSHYPDRNIVSRNIESAEILLWPEYQIPEPWQEQFNRPDIPIEKRRSKYYIVPDGIITISIMVNLNAHIIKDFIIFNYIIVRPFSASNSFTIAMINPIIGNCSVTRTRIFNSTPKTRRMKT